jgi:hypothetical protein|uniref:Uncharacterized protein n=1 Tax=viral metagenome TaxID=1070528 RepID=A0A6C0LVM2_9ZZZZ
MDKYDILAGYNGIMPLNLHYIPAEHRKNAIDEHLNDIKKYMKYQSELPYHLRYENTIGRICTLHKRDREASEKRTEDKKRRQHILYETLHGK